MSLQRGSRNIRGNCRSWISDSIRRYNNNRPSNVCLSGGVFANVKLNQRINELKLVKNLFVQPAMGDMGIPLGSLLFEMSKQENFQKTCQHTMSLGIVLISTLAALLTLPTNTNIRQITNFVSEVIDLISQDKVIGLIQGRAEYGPRALCNRSIIYHCRDNSINEWLNLRLNRSEFMPFAPVTTLEIAEKVFVGFDRTQVSADFMTVTYSVTDEFISKCPAAVHIDKTARPQIVEKNPTAAYINC